MAIRFITINDGQKVWMARVAYRGQRKSRVCRTKQEAKEAEAELLGELKAKAGQLEAAGAQPATVGALLDAYVLDLEARGKGPESVGRAEQTKTAMDKVLPTLVTTPLSRIRDRDVYDFRQARARQGAKPSTINRDLRTLRAAL
jgi:hypothetical protein